MCRCNRDCERRQERRPERSEREEALDRAIKEARENSCREERSRRGCGSRSCHR